MGKKRFRTKPFSEIPTVLTANIGSETRREIESVPEIFEKVQTPSPGTKIKSRNGPDSPFDSSSSSGTTTHKSSSAKKVSSEKRKWRRGTRRVKITKENIVEVYNVDDPMEVFSGSSGTHSYDSSRSAKSLTRHLSKSKYIASIPPDMCQAQYMITNPTVPICPVVFKTYNQPAFSDILKSKQSPSIGEFEPVSANEQQQQLVKKAVSNALTEFFDTGRDDLCLTIRVQRERQRPVMDIKLKKVPKRSRSEKRRGRSNGEKKSSGRLSSTSSSSCCEHQINSEDEEGEVRQSDEKATVEAANTLMEQLTAFGQTTYATLKNFWRN